MTDILRLSLPLTVWIAAFSAVYGLEGVVCSPHWDAAGLSLGQGRAALIVAWAAAVAVQVLLLLALRATRLGSPSGFVQGVATGLAVAALVATVWTLFPVAAIELCV